MIGTVLKVPRVDAEPTFGISKNPTGILRYGSPFFCSASLMRQTKGLVQRP